MKSFRTCIFALALFVSLSTRVSSLTVLATGLQNIGQITLQISGQNTINAAATLTSDFFTKSDVSVNGYFTFTIPTDISWTEDTPTTCTEYVQGQSISCAKQSATEMRITALSAFSANNFYGFQISGLQNPSSVRSIGGIQLASFSQDGTALDVSIDSTIPASTFSSGTL